MKKISSFFMVLISCTYISCVHKTAQQHYQGIITSGNVFVHEPMYKDTSNYEMYLRAMSDPFFGDHCDYLVYREGFTYTCVAVDTTLSPFQTRIQLGFAPGDTLYYQVAKGIAKFLIETGKEGNAIHVKLPRPEELKSWNVWKLLCIHEAVHVADCQENKQYKDPGEEETIPYLTEKDALKKMNPVWYDHFCTSFVPFYKDCGFCLEMLNAVTIVFDADSLSQIEKSSMTGALMIFIAMEAKGVKNGDNKKMNDILVEMNTFLQSTSSVRYY